MDHEVKVNQTFHTQLEDNGKWKKGDNKKYKEYRNKWNDNPQRFIVERGPIHLDVELSSICNLRCPMCFCTIELLKGEEGKITHGLMSMERYKKIIDEAVEIGVYSVKLNWRGEPLMHPRIAEMIQYAKEKGILDVMINTNGVKLNEELSYRIIEAGLDKIFFSIDSIEKENYEKIRVGAKFEKTIENVKAFCKINEEKGHPVYTRVQKVLLNDTEKENAKFVKYFSGIVDQVAFEDYEPYDGQGMGKEVKIKKNVQFTCSMPWQRLLITWNGEYRICCDCFDRGIFGHNDTQTIEEFWNGEVMKKIRNSHKRGKFYEVEVCRKCYLPYM